MFITTPRNKRPIIKISIVDERMEEIEREADERIESILKRTQTYLLERASSVTS